MSVRGQIEGGPLCVRCRALGLRPLGYAAEQGLCERCKWELYAELNSGIAQLESLLREHAAR